MAEKALVWVTQSEWGVGSVRAQSLVEDAPRLDRIVPAVRGVRKFH